MSKVKNFKIIENGINNLKIIFIYILKNIYISFLQTTPGKILLYILFIELTIKPFFLLHSESILLPSISTSFKF